MSRIVRDYIAAAIGRTRANGYVVVPQRARLVAWWGDEPRMLQ